MQLLFIDESGTPLPHINTHQSPYFVLGGVVIPEHIWHQVQQDLKVIKQRYQVQQEIKWRFFAPRQTSAKPNSLTHLCSDQKESLRKDLYSVITKYKSIKIISVVTHVARAYNLDYINSADDIYWYTYKQITERFQYYLQDLTRMSGQKTNGIIICDHRAPNDDKRLQELHAKLLLGSKDAHSSYDHLIEGVFIAPSHLSVVIQFADMVAGAVLRKHKDNDERFYSLIDASFRTSDKGKVDGYGLVQFPK